MGNTTNSAADGSSERADAPTREAFRTWLDIRTRNRDTDQFGHVNHASMTTLFEEARIALVFASGILDEAATADLLIVKLTMTFHKELRAPGLVQVGSVVKRIGTSSIDINQAIFDGSTCFASAEAVCVLLDKASRRPVRVPDAMRRHMLEG